MARLSERLRLRRASAVSAGELREPASHDVPEEVHHDEAIRPERDFSRVLPIGALGCEEHSVSRLLYERLGDEDVRGVELAMSKSPDLQGMSLDTPDVALRRQLTLHFGIWMGIPAIIERTGLRPDQPPPDVHAMARGPLGGAGGLYEGDLVADALLGAGVRIEEVRRGLDFGCSSGRVIRVLAAAFPEAHWIGCDPNDRSIAWAREKLPGIEFFVNGDDPPLPVAEGSLDLAFGISIWSHFEPQLGLTWFDEMRRLIRPGGHLVLTTHGLTSIAFYATNNLRTPQQCHEIADALYAQGWWYAPEFGEEGDWGVVNPAWGTSFLSPEWLLTQLCPRWRVLEFAPGRNSWNQDVYVLERP